MMRAPSRPRSARARLQSIVRSPPRAAISISSRLGSNPLGDFFRALRGSRRPYGPTSRSRLSTTHSPSAFAPQDLCALGSRRSSCPPARSERSPTPSSHSAKGGRHGGHDLPPLHRLLLRQLVHLALLLDHAEGLASTRR